MGTMTAPVQLDFFTEIVASTSAIGKGVKLLILVLQAVPDGGAIGAVPLNCPQEATNSATVNGFLHAAPWTWDAFATDVFCPPWTYAALDPVPAGAQAAELVWTRSQWIDPLGSGRQHAVLFFNLSAIGGSTYSLDITTPVGTSVSWDASTYGGKVDFPLSDDLIPQWPATDAAGHVHGVTSSGQARKITFTVKADALTITRTDEPA